LLLADADVLDQCVGIFLKAHGLEKLACLGDRRVPVDDATAGGFIAEEDVLGYGQIRDQGQFLVYDDDSFFFALLDVTELALHIFVEDLAFIGAMGIYPGEHFHQGRFARAVFTDQSMDFIVFDFKRDIAQRLDAGKGLGDVLHFEDCLGHRVTTPFHTDRWRRVIPPPLHTRSR